MMAKAPEDRYQSMAEVAAALTPFSKRLPVEFDFPRVLAWRAKEARRRFASQRRRPGASSVASSSWALRGLPSSSTKRLPQATADTAVESRPLAPQSSVSLVAPFAGAKEESSLSRNEVSQQGGIEGPQLVPLDNGERVPLVGDSVVIGRAVDCDVTLPFTMISSRHCELRFDGTLWRVIDLGSKNGVQVNGKTVTEQLLLPGDRLSIAKQCHFRVEYGRLEPGLVGRILPWAVAGVVAFAAALTGLYLWQMFAG
jgi:hypothetical protein